MMESFTVKISKTLIIEIQRILPETVQNEELQLSFKTIQKLNKLYQGKILQPQTNIK